MHSYQYRPVHARGMSGEHGRSVRGSQDLERGDRSKQDTQRAARRRGVKQRRRGRAKTMSRVATCGRRNSSNNTTSALLHARVLNQRSTVRICTIPQRMHAQSWSMCKRNIDTEDRKVCKTVRNAPHVKMRFADTTRQRHEAFVYAHRVRDKCTKLFANAKDLNELEAPDSTGQNHRPGSTCLAMSILSTVSLRYVHQHRFSQRNGTQAHSSHAHRLFPSGLARQTQPHHQGHRASPHRSPS